MGEFTNLHFSCELRHDTDSDVIKALQYMTGLSKLYAVPDEALCECARWKHFLRGDSYYSYAPPVAKLTQEKRGHKNSDSWYFAVICSFKNYDNELEKFLAWLDPYVSVHSNSFMLGYVLKPNSYSLPYGIYKWQNKPITIESMMATRMLEHEPVKANTSSHVRR